MCCQDFWEVGFTYCNLTLGPRICYIAREDIFLERKSMKDCLSVG